MVLPAGGGGFDFQVSSHMLNSAASYLHGQAQGIAKQRDAFNDACYEATGSFGDNGKANKGFSDFFEAWFPALDGQAETLESTADGTQQAAVVYDGAERHVYGKIAAMNTQPPPAPPSNNGLFPNPNRNVA